MMSLERAILNTLTWFDLWHQPLTSFECWYWLWVEDEENINITPLEISKTLLILQNKNLVKIDRGFWQLASSPSWAGARLTRARWSIAKRQRANLAAKLISRLPFIKLIALANTLAFNAAQEDSDIDLLIVVKKGRIFLSRLLITGLMQMLGWRRHNKKVKDRICLSFYLAGDHLNIQDLSYQDDPYLVYWLASLQPLADKNTFADLLLANSWAFKLVPNRLKALNKANKYTGKVVNLWEKVLGGKLGDMLEYWTRRWQLYLIKQHNNSRYGDGTSAVVVTDSVLKFHESDQRPQLAASWRVKQQAILAKYKL